MASLPISGAPLEGLRVLEVGPGLELAYGGKLLADLGADVIKVEPPAGDELRTSRRYAAQGSDEASPLFSYLNGHKRCVCVDVSSQGAEFRRLLDGADILLESLGPHVLESVVSGLEDYVRRHGRLRVVRVANFGQDGPRAGDQASEFTIQAAGGWLAARGPIPVPGEPDVPLQVGGEAGRYACGATIALAALTAWCSGSEPNSTDLSLAAALSATSTGPVLELSTDIVDRLGFDPRLSSRNVLGVRACKDGFVGLSTLTGQHFADLCAMIGAPQFAGMLEKIKVDVQVRADFDAAVDQWCSEMTVDEIVNLAQAMRIPATPVGDGMTLPAMTQWRERPFFVTSQGDGTAFLQPSPPWRYSRSRTVTSRQAAPLRAPDKVAWTSSGGRAGDAGKAPGSLFHGLRVLDLGTFWAAPWVGTYLGDFGADVIKIDSTRRPDGFRFMPSSPSLGPGWYEMSGVFQLSNMSKRGVAVNLNKPRGRELFLRMVAGSDVIIENYSTRVIEQFGIGWEVIRKVNPRAIFLRLPGYGLEGPWSGYVGWGNAFEQVVGLAYLTRQPGKPPVPPGGMIDPVVGIHAALGLMAAIVDRNRTGTGQMVEVPQIEVGASMTAEQVIHASLTGKRLEPVGNQSRFHAPQGVFQGSNGEWVALTVMTDDAWRQLAAELRAAGLPAGLENASAHERREADDRIAAALGNWAAGRTAEEAVDTLASLGVAAARVTTSAMAKSDPHFVHRGFYNWWWHPVTGWRAYPGWPFDGPYVPDGHHRFRSATLGEHNIEVLHGDFHIPLPELKELWEEGVIGNRPDNL